MAIITINGSKVSRIGFNQKQMTGEKVPGEFAAWDYFGTNPNHLLTLSYEQLSSRSTTLFHTHPPVSASINKLTNYAIGPGLVFRSQPDWDILGMTKKQAKDWGLRFQKLVHYMFKLLNYYEKQSVLFRTALIQGDSLLFFDRNHDDNLPFDLIETGGDQIKWDENKKDEVTLGIKHDKMLRRNGIVQLDGTHVNFRDENNDQNVIQFFVRQIARQLRGYPLAYKIISIAKNNDRWHDAMLARAVVESMIVGVSKSDGTSFEDQAENLRNLSLNTNRTEAGNSGLKTEGNVAQGQPGTMFSYGKGENIEFLDLKTPSNNFDKMQKAHIEMIGMATDVPPECVMSSYSTSFTAHKGALNDFEKAYMQKRNIFSNNVNKPVVREIAKYLMMEGLIEMPHPDFFKNPIMQEASLAGNWLGPVLGHVNPKQEVEAKQVAVENAFKLRSDAAAEFGNEFDNMIEEWQAEEEKWQEMSADKRAEKMAEQQESEENDPDDGEEDQEQPDDDNAGQEGDE